MTTTPPDTLLGTLIFEVSRVTALRCRYEGLRGIGGVNVEPAIAMMQAAIDGAITAVSESDPLAIHRAIRDLKGFTE